MCICLAPQVTSARPAPVDLAQDLLAYEQYGHIWTIWGDGSHLRQITFSSEWGGEPALSPDGRSVAYINGIWIDDDWISQIRVHNLITGWDTVVVTNWNTQGYDRSPCWSPDGKQLAFERFDYSQCGTSRSKIMTTSLRMAYWGRIRAAAPTPLNNSGDAWEAMPAWSPDGKYIAYVGDENHPYSGSIWIANVKTGSRREVAGGQSGNGWNWLYTPTWSPDGRKIAFLRGEIVFNDESSVTWNSSLNIVDPRAGSGQTLGETLFTPEEGFYVSDPSWSPSGWLYFPIYPDSEEKSDSQIVAMDPASSTVKPVCSGWFYNISVSRNPFYKP